MTLLHAGFPARDSRCHTRHVSRYRPHETSPRVIPRNHPAADLPRGRRHRCGNSLGVEPAAQTWLATAVSWLRPEDDAIAHAAGDEIRSEFEAAAASAQSRLRYTFMNDASWSPDVIASYSKTNVRRLRMVQKI
ncbi:6-hydroxy-D-nicotine oxidase [Apiospora hydei]|uniref:6-hydroxy-D-nicotine oxidase n=1 Tax=Apiospora hydei TaxID=1337664 RepID=A0ABR1UWS4_9PEZI